MQQKSNKNKIIVGVLIVAVIAAIAGVLEYERREAKALQARVRASISTDWELSDESKLEVSKKTEAYKKEILDRRLAHDKKMEDIKNHYKEESQKRKVILEIMEEENDRVIFEKAMIELSDKSREEKNRLCSKLDDELLLLFDAVKKRREFAGASH